LETAMYDLVVVGAGTAGCVAASTAAKAGLRVSLIDAKPAQEIGEKVCGDAVAEHHFVELGLAHPSGEELACRVDRLDFYSPNNTTVFHIGGPGVSGFMIHRKPFGQRLLREAVRSGAELRDGSRFERPILRGSSVSGVVIRNPASGAREEVVGRIVLEASGFQADVRESLPPELGIERDVKREDVCICYREIRELDGEIERPEIGRIHLSYGIAPGGYYWIFPKSSKIVNIGLGVQGIEGFPNPRRQFYKYLAPDPLLKGSRVIQAGGGIVPTRRPLNCLVANGLMIAGDAGCQANPVHGGGIGPSMLGGWLAAKTAVEAVERRNFTRDALWRYNVEYMRRYGYKQAGLDVLRMFLQRLGDKELSYSMSERVVTEEDVLRAGLGEEFRLNLSEKTVRVFRGIRRLGFVRQLSRVVSLLRETKSLYKGFPEPQDYERWLARAERVLRSSRTLALGYGGERGRGSPA